MLREVKSYAGVELNVQLKERNAVAIVNPYKYRQGGVRMQKSEWRIQKSGDCRKLGDRRPQLSANLGSAYCNLLTV